MKSYIKSTIIGLSFVIVTGSFFLVFPESYQSVRHAITILASSDLDSLKSLIHSYGAWGPLLSIALLILQAVIPPLPAFVIVVANAWVYGWFWGVIYSLIGGQLGALIAFGIARILGRPAVEKFIGEKQLKWADNFFEQYGAYAIFLARLTPVLSVDLISYGAGASTMSLKKYFWASTLGQLPALLVYSLLGNYASLTLEYFSFLIFGGGFLFLLGWLVKKRLEKKVKADTEYQKDDN